METIDKEAIAEETKRLINQNFAICLQEGLHILAESPNNLELIPTKYIDAVINLN